MLSFMMMRPERFSIEYAQNICEFLLGDSFYHLIYNLYWFLNSKQKR
jgi:hypothetical protein